MNDEEWTKLTTKYGVFGYTDAVGYIEYNVLLPLVEKAENWDLLFGDIDDPFYDIMKRLEKLHEIERRWMEASIMMGRKVLEHQTIAESEIAYQRELKDKLEAVKTWVETCPKYGEGGLEELEKILEDQSSGGSADK